MTTDPKAHAMPAGDAYAQSLAERHLPSDAAERIAARVPLPAVHDSAVVCLTPDGYAHGNMLEVQLQVPQGSGMRRGDVLYTADQLRAAILAGVREAMQRVASLEFERDELARKIVELARKIGEQRQDIEAMRGGVAVATVRADTGITLTADRLKHYRGARIPAGTPLYTAPPAGRVEVSDADRLEGYKSMLTPPDPDTVCIVLVERDGKLSPRIDTWCMQSESPLEWSSATIETGYCWDDHDPYEVVGWKPVGLLPSASELAALTAALEEPDNDR